MKDKGSVFILHDKKFAKKKEINFRLPLPSYACRGSNPGHPD